MIGSIATALLLTGFLGCASAPEVADVRYREPGLVETRSNAVFDGRQSVVPAGAGLLYVLGPFCSGTDVQTELRVGYRLLGRTWAENYVVGILEPGTYTLLARRTEPFEGSVAALPVVIESGKAGFVFQRSDPVRATLELEAVDEKNGSVHLKKRFLSMENTAHDFLGTLAGKTDVENTWERLFRTEALDAGEIAATGDVEAALSWVASVVAYGRNLGPFANPILRKTLLELSNTYADAGSQISSEPFTEEVRRRLDTVEAYFSDVALEEGAAPDGELAVELLRTVLSARAVHLEQDRIGRLTGQRDRAGGGFLYECADRRDRYLLTFLSSLEKTVHMASAQGIPSDTRFRVLECIDKLNASTLKGCLKNAHVHRGIQKLGDVDPDPMVRSHARRLTESILGLR